MGMNGDCGSDAAAGAQARPGDRAATSPPAWLPEAGRAKREEDLAWVPRPRVSCSVGLRVCKRSVKKWQELVAVRLTEGMSSFAFSLLCFDFL